MSRPALVLRPQPGADETARRVRAMGLRPVVSPLFNVRALEWQAPPSGTVDAVILTSANAARLGGTALTQLRHLPCYAVGGRTAAAARLAGFGEVHEGPADAAALVHLIERDRRGHPLHLAGREHEPLRLDGLIVRVVYAADPVQSLGIEALAALREGAVALLHSARAGATLAQLADAARVDRSVVRLAVISKAAAAAAGRGWDRVAAAGLPREAALLELAAKLCQED